MAMRRFFQFLYSLHAMPVSIDCSIPIGTSGAVGTISGPGVSKVTRLAAGIYQIQFQDNYSQCYMVDSKIQAPVTGANVNDGSFSTGTLYQITAVGTTNWQNVGLPSGLTAAVGMSFVATGAGGAGTGTAKVMSNSNILQVEMAGGPGLQLAPIGVGLTGGYVVVQCLGPVFTYNAGTPANSTVTMTPTDPADGSTLFLKFLLSNSSVKFMGD